MSKQLRDHRESLRKFLDDFAPQLPLAIEQADELIGLAREAQACSPDIVIRDLKSEKDFSTLNPSLTSRAKEVFSDVASFLKQKFSRSTANVHSFTQTPLSEVWKNYGDDIDAYKTQLEEMYAYVEQMILDFASNPVKEIPFPAGFESVMASITYFPILNLRRTQLIELGEDAAGFIPGYKYSQVREKITEAATKLTKYKGMSYEEYMKLQEYDIGSSVMSKKSVALSLSCIATGAFLTGLFYVTPARTKPPETPIFGIAPLNQGTYPKSKAPLYFLSGFMMLGGAGTLAWEMSQKRKLNKMRTPKTLDSPSSEIQ